MKKHFLISWLFLAFSCFTTQRAAAQQWDSLAGGMTADGISVLASYQGEIYAGGSMGFGNANVPLAKWNGKSWQALINNTSQSLESVFAIETYQGNLYIGGNFNNINGTTISGIAQLNGSNWIPVGGASVSISAMTVYNGKLYVGGYFSIIGGDTTNGIARWNGNNWESVGGGLNLNGQVNTMTVYNGNLIIGGFFTNAGNIATNQIAQWNDTTWSALGAGGDANGQTTALESYNGNLYVLGAYNNLGISNGRGVAMWNGTSWSNASGTSGMLLSSGTVSSLKTYNGYLYAGGKYSVSVGAYFDTYGLVKWDGNSWDTIPSMMTSPYSTLNIAAMTVWNNSLYVAGNFITIHGITSKNVAKWTAPAPSNELTVYTTQSNPTCSTYSDGKAYVHVSGGFPTYTYSWSPSGGTADSATGLHAGTYTVHISDLHGDTASQVVYITAPAGIQYNAYGTPPSCHQSDGSASVSVFSFGTFSYSWNTVPAQTSTTVSGLPAGSYTVTITDPSSGCTYPAAVSLPDSCKLVWPGDANNDGAVDMSDILAIGIGNGTTGQPRNTISTQWTGQPSTQWTDTLLSGTNYQFIDCNGDGTINATDTAAVLQNFGSIHHRPIVIPPYNASLPDLSLKSVPDTIPSNAYGTIQIGLGTSTLPASNVYGLAFDLLFDSTLIDPASIRLKLNGSWMGTNGTNLIGVAHTISGTGRTAIAITRTNQQNANGNGFIGTLTYKTTSALIGTMHTQHTGITIANLIAISANQQTLSLNATGDNLLLEDPRLALGIKPVLTASLDWTVAPNPFNGSTTIQLNGITGNVNYVLFDLIGKEIRRFQSSDQVVTLEKGDLKKGMYLLKVYSGDKLFGEKKLIVE